MDYQTIIENLTEDRVKDILNKLEIPFEDKGNYLTMPTYCHNHKDEECSHKLYYYKNNKVFMCFTNCGGTSIFKFLKNYYESQQYEYDWYNDIYCLIIGTSEFEGIQIPKYHSLNEKYSLQKKNIKLPEYNSKVLDCFVKKYPSEWINDGISKEAIDKYNIKFSISQNKIIIPHYDIDNRLVGIRGRALNQDQIDNIGKYMPIQIEGIWYKHPLSMNLYGLNFNKKNIEDSGICYLGESEKFVLQIESFNMINCGVAVCGSQFNKFALNLLLKAAKPKEIIICFDNQELDKQDKYFNKLYSICEKYKNYTNFSFIYDRRHLTKLKDSPTDCGEDIFKKLLQERVKIK